MGSLHTQVARPFILAVLQFVTTTLPYYKENGPLASATQELQLGIMALSKPSHLNNYLTHLFGETSYDGTSVLIEMIFAVGEREIFMKNLWTEAVTAMQGEVGSGPPPPSGGKHILKNSISKSEVDLGIK